MCPIEWVLGSVLDSQGVVLFVYGLIQSVKTDNYKILQMNETKHLLTCKCKSFEDI